MLWEFLHNLNIFPTVKGCIQYRPSLHLVMTEMAREIWNKGKNAFRMWMCLGCFWSSFLLPVGSYLCWLLSPLSLYCRSILISSIWKDSAPQRIRTSLSFSPLSFSSIFYFSILILFAAVLNSLRWTLTRGTISNCSLGIQYGTTWRYDTKNS